MLFAGYLVSIDQMSLTAAVTAGVAGNIVGSWIAWGVGMTGGRMLLERHGRYFHITPARLDMADRWFEQRGERIVLIAAACPSSAPSSHSPPASHACPSGASRSTPPSAACPGYWGSP